MKRIILTAITVLFCMSLFSQPAGYHEVYNTYKGEEGVISIWVPGILLKFVGAMEGLDRDERDLLRSLRSVHVLTMEKMHLYPGVNFVDEMDPNRMKGDYNLMLEVHDGDDDVIIAAREKRGKITDLIVVVGGEENVLVHVRGRMKSDLLEDLANVSGVDELHVTAKL